MPGLRAPIANLRDRAAASWRRLHGDDAGNFAILAALLLPVLIGSTALAVEYGQGLVTRAKNQRVADMAAFAGAVNYGSTNSEVRMKAVAAQVATLNGIAADRLTVSLVPSPRGEGEVVHVAIAVEQSIVLGTLLGALPELSIVTNSYASIGGKNTPPACIVALDRNLPGIVLSGGTQIAAPNCTIASNASVAVPCGTSITSKGVTYDTNPPTNGCNGIRDPQGGAAPITKTTTPDPLAGNARVASATARLASVATMTPPTTPVVKTGPDLSFGYTTRASMQNKVAQAGCSLGNTADYSGQWIVNCGGQAKVYNFGAFTVPGGVKLELNAEPGKRFEFSGGLRIEGTASFPAGEYVIAKGLYVASGTATFGKGRFHVGANTPGCSYSICTLSGGKLTIDGPSAFSLTAGLKTGGGARMVLGAGQTNVFDIGAARLTSGVGNAIDLEGGSTTILADAMPGDAGNDPASFRVHGHINGGGGGTCFIVSAAPHHDIAGNFIGSGAVVLGAGIYTIDGAFLLGSSGGGGATCDGQSISLMANNVSLVLSGKSVGTAGSCNGKAFCVGAGYSNIVLRAPTSGAYAGLAVIGPVDGRTAGASLVEGASNARISGAFYFPTGPIAMGGGSGLAGGGGDCLQMIGSRIELTGGAAAASDCLGEGGGSGRKKRVVLVQ